VGSGPSALDVDWHGLCRAAVSGISDVLAEHPTTLERAVETGRGEGGDEAIVIDRAAEDVVFELLEEQHRAGHRFRAVSEERGEVDFGDDSVVVVIDPLDGSMNAKRGLSHHAVSIAVADGSTMGDVAFGYVYDFGVREEWSAKRGVGAQLNGIRIVDAPNERRDKQGRLELVGIESADPRWVVASADTLAGIAHRVRAIGTIASALCQVAGARFDGMVSLRNSRAVDAAAAQLIAREAGAHVAFIAYDDPLAAPLDLVPHSPVVAARTPEGLAELARVPATIGR
jgi:myo-inositol-1(or 4)-monophosphatase